MGVSGQALCSVGGVHNKLLLIFLGSSLPLAVKYGQFVGGKCNKSVATYGA